MASPKLADLLSIPAKSALLFIGPFPIRNRTSQPSFCEFIIMWLSSLDRPVAEVMTVAKRALRCEDKLDQFGGDTFHGVMDRAEEAKALNALPVGLASGAEIV